jgi:hypothetical protein
MRPTFERMRKRSAMGGTPQLATRASGVAASGGQGERCRTRALRDIVERWNAAPTHDWSPAIGTALKAGYRWLDVFCGGCCQVKAIDLASVDIHPQACLTSLILLLRCWQCGGHGPLPQLVGLSRLRLLNERDARPGRRPGASRSTIKTGSLCKRARSVGANPSPDAIRQFW